MKKTSILAIIVLAILLVLYLVFAWQKNKELNEPIVEQGNDLIEEMNPINEEGELINEEMPLVEEPEFNGGIINEEMPPVGSELNGELETAVEVEPVFCTMDVMECPDGSFVGRIAPDCDFAACPLGITQE